MNENEIGDKIEDFKSEIISILSRVDEERVQLESFITKWIENDYVSYLYVLSKVLAVSSDSRLLSVTSVLLMQFFRPSISNSLDVLKEKWNDGFMEGIRESILNSLHQNIYGKYQNVRNCCAKTFSHILSIDSSISHTLISDLFGNIFEYQNHDALDGAIICIKECVSSGFDLSPYSNECKHWFYFQSDLLKSDCLVNLKINSIMLTIEIARNIPNILDNQSYLHIMSTNIQIADSTNSIDLYRYIFDLTFEIYLHVTDNLDDINLKIREIGFPNINQYDKVCIASYFWKRIISFVFKNLEEKQQERSPLIYGNSLLLVTYFLEALTKIDENNTDIDDQGSHSPAYFAFETLQMLYRFCPDIVFYYIQDFYTSNISDEKWNIVHAVILSIGVFCIDPPNIISFQFINQAISELILPSLALSIPKIREASLNVLLMIIRVFNICSDFKSFESVFSTLISFKFQNVDEIKACSHIISEMCLKASTDIVDEFFEQIIGIVNHFCSKIKNSSDLKVIFSSLHDVITHCSSSDTMMTIFHSYLDSILVSITEMSDNNYLTSQIILLSSLIQKIGDNLGMKSKDIYECLISLLSISESSVVEEAMIALIKLYESGVCFPDQYDSWLGIFCSISNSEDIRLINISMKLIETLFSKYHNNMNSSLPYVMEQIQLVFSRLNPFLKRATTPQIVYALSEMVNSINYDAIYQYIGIIQHIIGESESLYATISVKDLDEKRFMAKSILSLYKNIFKASPEDSLLLLELMNISCAFIDSVFKAKICDDSLLISIYELVFSIGTKLKQKSNVKLNKKSIRNLIEQGEQSGDQKTKSFSKKISKFIDSL